MVVKFLIVEVKVMMMMHFSFENNSDYYVCRFSAERRAFHGNKEKNNNQKMFIVFDDDSQAKNKRKNMKTDEHVIKLPLFIPSHLVFHLRMTWSIFNTLSCEQSFLEKNKTWCVFPYRAILY